MQTWPDRIWLVRHGESAGNVARDLAEAGGLAQIEIATRDMDVPLSDRGIEQAEALAHWIAEQPAEQRPTTVLASPYVRARQTADRLLAAAGLTDGDLVVDERLREREFGILDRLTRAGIVERFPEQAELRAFLGKFYHRPPGGESWCDVGLRLRSVVDSLARDYAGERVLIVSHQVVITMFRYLFERMTEEEVLQVDREAEIANCSLTQYAYDASGGRGGGLVLTRYNEVFPLVQRDAPVTRKEDAPVARG